MSIKTLAWKPLWFFTCLLVLAGCKPDVQFSGDKFIVDEGTPVNLIWQVKPYANTEIVSVVIDQGVGDVALTGETALYPLENTRYTLTALADDNRTTEKSVRVLVSKACIENRVAIPDASEATIPRQSVTDSVGIILPLCDGLVYYTKSGTRSLHLMNVVTGEQLQQYTYSTSVQFLKLDRKYGRLYVVPYNSSTVRIIDLQTGNQSSFSNARTINSLSVDDDGMVFFDDMQLNSVGQRVYSTYRYDPVSRTVAVVESNDVTTGGVRIALTHNAENDEYLYAMRNNICGPRLYKATLVTPYPENPTYQTLRTQKDITVFDCGFNEYRFSPDFSTLMAVDVSNGERTLTLYDLAKFQKTFTKVVGPAADDAAAVAYSHDGSSIAIGSVGQVSLHSATNPAVTQYISIASSACAAPGTLRHLAYSTNGEYLYGIQDCGGSFNVFYRRVAAYSSADPENIAPVASAGPDREVATGSVVTLDGRGSSDANGDALHYAWHIEARPSGSVAEIVNPNAAVATFSPDVEGNYRISLTVNDGEVDSVKDTVLVTAFTMPLSAPRVDWILPAETSPGTMVTVSGEFFAQATVTLNGVLVVPHEKTDTLIRFAAPSLSPGVYDLDISNRLGSVERAMTFKANSFSAPDMQVTITGLPAGLQMSLRDSISGEAHVIEGNGLYVFGLDVVPRSNYEVAIVGQPEGYHCSGVNLKGSATFYSVAAINIDCIPSVAVPDGVEYAVRGELRDVGVGVYHVCYIDSYGTHCLGNAPDYGSMPALGCEYDLVNPCPSRIDVLEVPPHPGMRHPHKIDVGNNQLCVFEGDVIYCWLGYTFNQYVQTTSYTSSSRLIDVVANEYEICSIENNGTLCRGSTYQTFASANPVDVDMNSDARCVLYYDGVRCNGRTFNISLYVAGGTRLALDRYSTQVCVQRQNSIHCATIGGTSIIEGIPDLLDIGFVGNRICALTSTDLRCWSHPSLPYESTPFSDPVRLWTEHDNYCVETRSELICSGTLNVRIGKY